MKFADNGYYIEQYVKCENCGVLIYEDGKTIDDAPGRPFCSQWCIDWYTQRKAGVDSPRVELPFDS